MKTIPAKVNILGQLWFVNSVVDLEDVGQAPVDGLCHPNLLKIDIEKYLPVERQREVLLHEIIHAVDSIFDLELSERQVDKLARGLYGSFATDSVTRDFIFGET